MIGGTWSGTNQLVVAGKPLALEPQFTADSARVSHGAAMPGILSP